MITIRVFFRRETGKQVRNDGGYLDLEVEHIEGATVFWLIQLQLSGEFSLHGDSRMLQIVASYFFIEFKKTLIKMLSLFTMKVL